MTAAPLEIAIDRDRCRGAAECLYRAPGTFALDGQGKSMVTDPTGDDEDTILAAARSCPNFAIEVKREGKKLG